MLNHYLRLKASFNLYTIEDIIIITNFLNKVIYMKKEEIEKFYDKHDFDKSDVIDKKYDGNWENPPIPEGKKLVFEVF